MAEPNHDADQPPASPTAEQDPGVSPDQDPTQQLSKMFAGTTLGLGVPTDDAPTHHADLQPPAAAGDGESVSPTSCHDHDPGATTSSYGDDLTRVLTSMFTKPPLAAPLAVPPLNIFAQPGAPTFHTAAGRDLELPHYRIRIRPEPHDITELLEKLVGEAMTSVPVTPTTPSSRASVRTDITARAPQSAGGSQDSIHKLKDTPNYEKPEPETAGGGRAERAARRREERRLFSVPTDYLRAGQESRERRRRREMVRRNVRRIFSIHKERTNDRVLSAMMARQATLEPVAPQPAASDGGPASAAASSEHAAAPSSSEDPDLGEILMEMSFKD
jgi:hypothetical protein